MYESHYGKLYLVISLHPVIDLHTEQIKLYKTAREKGEMFSMNDNFISVTNACRRGTVDLN